MKTHYFIDIEYWTEFQRQFAEKFLDDILKNFDIALQAHHKKNKVTITKTFESLKTLNAGELTITKW